MKNLYHQEKRILGLKPATLRDIIIILGTVLLICFVAVSAKAETTEKVTEKHHVDSQRIEELEKKQQRDDEFLKNQVKINGYQTEFNRTQLIINKEAIEN